ncbi:MAG: energy-coupling factor transporter transmembrane component T [Anaerolineaceae bacterium]
MLVSWHYKYRGSPMDHIDPRARWIFSFAFLIAATSTWNSAILAVLFSIAVIWYGLGRTTWKETRRGWMLVMIMLFTMIVVNTIITGGGAGGVVPEGGRLVWPEGVHLFGRLLKPGLTVDRIWFAICQLMRIGGISMFFILIPYTMDSRSYGATFSKLGMPDKLAYTMELAIRFIPSLARNFSVTLDAQRARAFELDDVKGGIIRKIGRIAPLLIPITMNAILSSEDIANAMDLRGFGQRKRTWLFELKYHWWDYAVIAFGLLIVAATLILVYGYKLGSFTVPPFFYQLFE